MPPSGVCPACGRSLAAPALHPTEAGAADDAEPVEEYKAPWHFKLMVALAVVYLGWRLVQMVSWFV